MKKRLQRIPDFASEAEERAFWESGKNDSTQYIDWSKAKVVSLWLAEKANEAATGKHR